MLKSLRAKLVLVMILVCTLPLLGFGVATVLREIYIMDDAAQAILSGTKEGLVHTLKVRHDALLSHAKRLAMSPVLLTTNTAAILELFTQTRADVTNVASITLTDARGMSSINTANAVLDLSIQEHVQRALRGEASGAFRKSAIDGSLIWVFAAPVRNQRNAIVGAVTMATPLATDPYLPLTPFEHTGERYLVNREGLFITASRFVAEAPLSVMASAPARERFAPGAEGKFFGRYVNYQGQEVFGMMELLPGIDVVVVSEVGVREMRADALAGIWFMAIAFPLLIAAASLGGWLYATRLTARILPVVKGVQAVAAGDLTYAYTASRDNDELGDLSRAFAQMIGDLRTMISGAQAASFALAEKSTLISGSIKEVAAGNDSQAGITQEISRTLEQLAAATEEIAANAQSATAASANARTAAAEGTAKVGNSINSLKTVQESVFSLSTVSKQIGGIVSAIDDISDQTNLLALNAAIEAARAGEHGRGFAVVADAVRSLAEQSRQSTKEITKLIASIQGQIDGALTISTQGAAGAKSAQDALENIVAQINSISLMVEGISAAGEEQAAAANEVSASMENLGAITEQVAASSQESATAGQQLNDLAKSLYTAASKFRT